MRIMITLCAVLACATAAAGDVYKWKDKDGRVHYGDKPKSGEAEAVAVEPEEEGADPSAAAAAENAAREAECKQKKSQLEAWRRAPTMSEVDNLGKTREYTPAERQQFLDMTQTKVDALCAPRAPAATAGTFPPPEEPYTPIEPPPDENAPAPKKKP